ncbi:hypothetical protein M2341_002042 [Sphingobium sp. B7D2B]|uniref:fibronectin type III domain-containing protein n=1 Tax=Sphingobium sp. B7D2B TaxID=2940583 RepID=UPI0022243D24|nr:fibronectin type III domain-containing protein [Sphingobium sp. B7D2B]MCW2366595.1 hypothetical protein [Sphingobium sp. B7D2B]
MSNAMIMRPLPVAVLSGTNSLPGYQPSNIANDWLGMVWKGQAAGTASQSFIVDLREDLPADTIALLGLSGAASSWLLQVSAATDAQGAFTGASHAWPAVPLLAGSVMFPSGRGRSYWEKPATGPSAARYWRVTITTPANNTPVTVARVVIGQRLQPERNFSFGAAFGIRDHGKAEWSTRAVLLRRRGLKLRSTGLSFASLYRDEIENLVDPILAAVGATDPILLVTDPDPHAQRQNRIYFGPLIGDIGTIWARANAGFQWQANVVDLEPIGDVGASFIPPTPTPAPNWTSPPSVSGAGSPPRVGDVLTANGGTILNGDHAGWRWLRDGALISGATGVTYVLTIDDLAALVGPRQLASGPGGSGSNDGDPVGPVNPTVPAVISGLTATAGDGQVVLTLSAPANGGAAITDYVYQYKLNSASTWTTFSDGASATPGTTITGLTNTQDYNFRVAAVNSVGQQTTWSNVANATPVAAVPSMPAVGNLVMHFRVEDIPAQADNTAFAGNWVDSVSGAAISQATTAWQPLYRTSRSGGKPALQVNGTSYLSVGRPAAMIAAMNNATTDTGCTAFFVLNIAESTVDDFRVFWGPRNVNDGDRSFIASKTKVTTRGGTADFTNRVGYAIIVVRQSSLLNAHFFDQGNAHFSATGPLSPHSSNNYAYGHSSQGYDGVNPTDEWGFRGDLMDFGFYNKALTNAEIFRLIKAMNAKFGQPLPWAGASFYTFIDGNSYTSGRKNWAALLLNNKGVPFGASSNLAISGRTISQMRGAVNANFAGVADELGIPIVLLANEFYNSADATSASYIAYLNEVKAIVPGIRRGWLDAWDNARPVGQGPRDNRAASNAAMASATTAREVLIPISGDATVGLEGACPEEPGPYGPYFADNVGHPTPALSSYVASFAGPYWDTLVTGL